MPVYYSFGNATAAIPLSQLDNNFATPITIGNVAAQLGNVVSTIGNVTLANVTITSVSTPLTPAQGGTGLTTPGASGNVLTSNGTAWVSGAGGTAAVANGTIYINSTYINTSYTIAANTNGFTVGPVTISAGNYINVSSGQRWVVL